MKILLVYSKNHTPRYCVDYSRLMSFPNRYENIREMIYRQQFQEDSFESEIRWWVEMQSAPVRHFHLLKQIHHSRKL